MIHAGSGALAAALAMTRGFPWFGLVFAAFVAACGQSASAGHDGAGDDGMPVVAECPDIAPRAMSSEPCPENLPAEGCSYTLDCASGQRDFTFVCSSQFWYVEPSPCERQWEFCTGGDQQVRCDEGFEGDLVWGGRFTAYDGPAACPTETPHDGDPCGDGPFAMLACGYFCDDGTTWTTGHCDDSTRTWVFDGACDP
jgi:hypothetical protein